MEKMNARVMFGIPDEIFELTLSHDVAPPRLIKGDRVMIDPSHSPTVGDWAFVSWEQNCLPVLANVTREGRKRYVISDDWQEKRVPLDSDIEILGTVIESSRSFA